MAVEINKHIGFFAEALLRPQLGHIGSGALPAQRPIVFDFALRKKLDLETFTRGSGAMYWDGPAGKLASVGNNVPVREWSARGIFKGRRIEEPRTNLLLWSEEFDNPSWTKTDFGGDGEVPVVTANAAASPSGEVSADEIVFDAVTETGQSALQQSFSSVAGLAIASIWLRTASGQGVIQARFDGNDGSAWSEITLWTVTSSWQRFTLATSRNGATIFGIRLRPDQGTDQSLTLYAWGAQLEAGSFPTSYIKTEGTPATRAADVCTIDDISGFFNATEGTILVEFEAMSVQLTSPSVYYIASFSNGSFNESMSVRIDSVPAVRWLIVDGGVTQANPSGGAVAAGTVHKAAAAYASSDFAISLDGADPVADTDGTLPTVSEMAIGMSPSGASQLNGHIRRILYWPKRLPNQQLQLLSKAA